MTTVTKKVVAYMRNKGRSAHAQQNTEYKTKTLQDELHVVRQRRLEHDLVQRIDLLLNILRDHVRKRRAVTTTTAQQATSKNEFSRDKRLHKAVTRFT